MRIISRSSTGATAMAVYLHHSQEARGGAPRTRARPPRHRLRRLGQLTNTLTYPWKPGGGALHWHGVCATRPPPAITPLGTGSQMYWAVYPESTLEYPI